MTSAVCGTPKTESWSGQLPTMINNMALIAPVAKNLLISPFNELSEEYPGYVNISPKSQKIRSEWFLVRSVWRSNLKSLSILLWGDIVWSSDIKESVFVEYQINGQNKLCATCEYWIGPRQPSFYGNAVILESQAVKGKCWCLNGPHPRADRYSNFSFCFCYKKWSALR